jgi:preprotein translocase subunit SecG
MLLVRITVILIALFICTSVVFSYIIISKYNAAFDSWSKLLIPFIQLILTVLAYRGIKKDDNLVKSYDRLR